MEWIVFNINDGTSTNVSAAVRPENGFVQEEIDYSAALGGSDFVSILKNVKNDKSGFREMMNLWLYQKDGKTPLCSFRNRLYTITQGALTWTNFLIAQQTVADVLEDAIYRARAYLVYAKYEDYADDILAYGKDVPALKNDTAFQSYTLESVLEYIRMYHNV